MKPSTNLALRAFELLYMLISALPVMLLWNSVVSVVFSLPEITYLQSAALVLLSHFLFNSPIK